MKTLTKILITLIFVLSLSYCTKPPVDETPYCWTCNVHTLVNGQNSSQNAEICDKTEYQIKQLEDKQTFTKSFDGGYITSETHCIKR